MADTADDAAERRIEFWNAILIALVTVIAAVVAWRASVAADGAGDADFAGIQAVVNREETETLATVESTEHARAHAAYRRFRQTAEVLDTGSGDVAGKSSKASAEADALADAKLTLFPNRYMAADGTYRVEKEIGQTVSSQGRTTDLEPGGDFTEADQLRAKTEKLLTGVVLLTFSLVMLTLVEAFSGTARRLFFVGGALLGIAATIFSIMTEL
jgi:hypothetical protein